MSLGISGSQAAGLALPMQVLPQAADAITFREGNPVKVYGDLRSGNCYKIKLLLEQLALSYEWVAVDILAGATRTEAFLAMNPNGRIPVLEIDAGDHLAESNAILWYLAEGTPFLPTDRWHRAQVLQWMFFEQYSHEPYIATSRYIVQYLGRPAHEEERLRQKAAPGYRALDVMEGHLAERRFFVAERYSIADVALYAYTHVAGEGGFDLAGYPAIRAWLARVASEPRHVGMRG